MFVCVRRDRGCVMDNIGCRGVFFCATEFGNVIYKMLVKLERHLTTDEGKLNAESMESKA
jgi:hypothetical protein